MKIGKKIGLDPLYWGSKSEAEFLKRFKGIENEPTLKKAYAKLPKPKPVKTVKKKVKAKKENG
tara:strand:+ start:2486 stop:2674 length:189 start_codon:yes stop_codon:yes gene_type:complete